MGPIHSRAVRRRVVHEYVRLPVVEWVEAEAGVVVAEGGGSAGAGVTGAQARTRVAWKKT